MDNDLDIKNITEFSSFENLNLENEEKRFKLFLNFINDYNSDNINLIEVGGGNKPIFSYIKKFTNKNIFSYVIERKEIFEKYNNCISPKYKKDLIYINDFANIDFNNFSIVYFGSSIQYFEEFESFKKKLFKSKIKYVVIMDTIFNKLDYDFYSLQINMKPSIFPVKFLSIKKLINDFKKYGYNLFFDKSLPNKKFKHNKYNDELEIKYIIFKKN